MIHLWDVGLNYLTATFNDYDLVALWRLIPHHIGARPITLALIAQFSWFTLVQMHTLQSITLHQNFSCVNNTDAVACMWENQWNNSKKIRDISQYKPGVRNKNNALIWFAAVYFSYSHYDNNISNYWMVSYKMFQSNLFAIQNWNITKQLLLSNEKLMFRRLNRLASFLCAAFSADVSLLSFEIYGK